MNLLLLERHLKVKHPEHEDKLLQFFQWSLKSWDTQSEVSHLTAKKKTPYYWAAFPTLVKMAEIINGEQHCDKLKSILLSVNTAGRCTEELQSWRNSDIRY